MLLGCKGHQGKDWSKLGAANALMSAEYLLVLSQGAWRLTCEVLLGLIRVCLNP